MIFAKKLLLCELFLDELDKLHCHSGAPVSTWGCHVVQPWDAVYRIGVRCDVHRCTRSWIVLIPLNWVYQGCFWLWWALLFDSGGGVVSTTQWWPSIGQKAWTKWTWSYVVNINNTSWMVQINTSTLLVQNLQASCHILLEICHVGHGQVAPFNNKMIKLWPRGTWDVLNTFRIQVEHPFHHGNSTKVIVELVPAIFHLEMQPLWLVAFSCQAATLGWVEERRVREGFFEIGSLGCSCKQQPRQNPLHGLDGHGDGTTRQKRLQLTQIQKHSKAEFSCLPFCPPFCTQSPRYHAPFLVFVASGGFLSLVR